MAGAEHAKWRVGGEEGRRLTEADHMGALAAFAGMLS